MRSIHLLLAGTAAVLVAFCPAWATKYYFNSFDSNSMAAWTQMSGSDPQAGLYRWYGGAHGYEMIGYDANLARGKGVVTNATPAAQVASDFWMSADFRHLGGYTGGKQAATFFINAAGQGMGVYCYMARSVDGGTTFTGDVECGLIVTDNYSGITSVPGGVINGATKFGCRAVFDYTNWDQNRVDVNWRDSSQYLDIYFNGNLIRRLDLLVLPAPPDPNIVRNFTKVGTYFYNTFSEPATYDDPNGPFSCLSIDDIWCGSTPCGYTPYNPSTSLPGDANGDGIVSVGDLGILAAGWNTGGATWAGSPISQVKNPGQPIWPTMGGGDFNHDGTVDVIDLGIMATNWKKTATLPVQPTPEPASMTLLAAAGLGVLARRKR